MAARGLGVPTKICLPLSPTPRPPEKKYNFSQIQTRNAVERAFGVLKKRFQVLGRDGGGVRCDMETGSDVVNACFTLHNFLRRRKDFFEPDPPIPPAVLPAPSSDNTGGDGGSVAERDARRILIQKYFN